MNSVKNGVNLNNDVALEEVKEMTYDVSMWWYELHGGKVQVIASSEEEAIKLVEENMSEYIELAKKYQDTYSGSNGEEGIDNAVIKKEEIKNEDEIYRDRFDTDIYVETTSYHSYYENNILEIGKVKYSDYISNDKLPYKFSGPTRYEEDFGYYDLGACPSRDRETSIFEKEDYSKLLLKSLLELNNKYTFAKSIDEILEGEKYLLMLENNGFDNGLYKPITLQVRAVKVKKGSERVPFKIAIHENSDMKITNINELKEFILDHELIYSYGDSAFSLYLNTKEGLNDLVNKVTEYIGYTFK